MTIYNGYVGINNVTPITTLDVRGNINVNNAGSVLEFLTPAGAATPVAALGDGFSLVAVESVPEPASLAMVATALALAGGVRLRATPTEINESTNQGEK